MSDTGDAIRANSVPIQEWATLLKTKFTEMQGSMDAVASSITDLEYEGPNAQIVGGNTGQTLTTLATSSQAFMAAAVRNVGAVTNVILGAGGVMSPAAYEEPVDAKAYAVDKVNVSTKISVNPTAFRASASLIDTEFGNIQQAAQAIVNNLEEIPVSEWQGQSRTAVEAAIRENIGTGAMAIAPEVRIGGVEMTGGETGISLMDSYAKNFSILANTLYGQMNSALDADEEAAGATSAAV